LRSIVGLSLGFLGVGPEDQALAWDAAAGIAINVSIQPVFRDHIGKRAGRLEREPRASLQQRMSFEIRAEWDGESEVWWCSNDELPLTTEAPTFKQLVSRVLEIASGIAAENGLAAGDEIEVHLIAEHVQSVPVVAT
jgi:hypothetical protein